jgi:hypothetical protein
MVCAVLFVMHSASYDHTMASQTTLLDAEQSLRAQYGEALSFSVETTAPTVLSSAQITIQMTNRAQVYVLPVSFTPTSTVSLNYTVKTEEINLLPAATLTYYWVFKDATGQMFQTEAITARYGDSQVPWHWQELRSGQIVVLSALQDQVVNQAVVDVTATALNGSTNLLGTSIKGDVIIYVYPGLAAMANSLRKHHTIVQDWVVAYAIPEQQTIFISAESGPDTLINLARDLPHEVMHLAVYAASGGNVDHVPGWLDEGLAVGASGETDPTLQEVLGQAISNRILLSLETLCTSDFFSLPPRDAALAYAQSGSLVSYIGRRYGSSQLNALVRAYGSGLNCSQGVELVLGITLSDLETQWLRDLSTSTAIAPPDAHSVTPWLAAWAVSLVLAALFLYPQSLREVPMFDTRVALPRVSLDSKHE